MNETAEATARKEAAMAFLRLVASGKVREAYQKYVGPARNLRHLSRPRSKNVVERLRRVGLDAYGAHATTEAPAKAPEISRTYPEAPAALQPG